MTEAEQGVIGGVLIDDCCIKDIYGKLEPKMFSCDFGRTCFNEMLAMYDTGTHISHVELSQRLESYRIDSNDIKRYLTECIAATPTSALVRGYADTICRDYKSREVKKIISDYSLLPVDIDDTIANVISRLEELQTAQGVRSKTMAQIVKENKDNYFTEIEKDIVKTGFEKLDDCLVGLEKGDIVVIGARPGVGKSAIVAQIMSNISGAGKKIGYFNLEMPEPQVYERVLSQTSEIGLTRIRRAKSFLGDEELKFNSANADMEKMNIVVSSGTKTVGEIKSESRHQNFDVIIVDYLQLIRSDHYYGNRVSEVGDISKALKSLAMELNVPVILLSQMNRSSEQRETKEPEISELRESGDIEQDASIILLLWNLSEDDKSLKGLKIGKNRQGESGKMGLRFDGDHMKFIEMEEDFGKVLEIAKNSVSGFGGGNDCPF